MLAALLTFQDSSEEVHNGNSQATPLNNRNQSAEVAPGKSGAEIVEQIQVKAGVCDVLPS